jgi:hypothetical protein
LGTAPASHANTDETVVDAPTGPYRIRNVVWLQTVATTEPVP